MKGGFFNVAVLMLIACNGVKHKNQPVPVPDTASPAIDTGLHLMKGFELYVWEINGKVFYNLLPGTNRIKRSEEIYDTTVAIKTLDLMKQKLDQLREGEFVFLKASRVDSGIIAALSDYMRSRKLNLTE